MLWLAHSNYQLDFSPDTALSERVIFPVSENESRGIEDARFVRFNHPDGRVVYYATYSAYNGFRVLPQLIETTDFRHFKMNTLNGRCVQNKGMALFPRKIGDRVRDGVAARRREHLPLAFGQHPFLERVEARSSTEVSVGVRPGRQLRIADRDRRGLDAPDARRGCRCGSTGIGALLLDLEDPSRVIGELREPLARAEGRRARRLRAERRLLVRRDAPRRPSRHPVCRLRQHTSPSPPSRSPSSSRSSPVDAVHSLVRAHHQRQAAGSRPQ